MLIDEIAPRLRATVPHSVRPVGCEDGEELIQDGLLLAAELLVSLEARGKQVSAGNIVYYVLLHLKSGRRSHSSGRTDVMGSGTQLDSSSCVLSFETEISCDPETGESVSLGDILISGGDDPSTAAARNLDWEEFLGSHDARYEVVVGSTASGGTMRGLKARFGLSDSSLSSMKSKLALEIREFMGPDVIAEASRVPQWRRGIAVAHEKSACRADRRRA